MASDLQRDQEVEIAGPRGTRQHATVIEVTDSGEVLLNVGGVIEIVDREDVISWQ